MCRIGSIGGEFYNFGEEQYLDLNGPDIDIVNKNMDIGTGYNLLQRVAMDLL